MKCRKFCLQNAEGARYDLNGSTGVYVRDPAGLGISTDPTFADLRHGFFLPTSDDTRPQESFTGTFVFTRAPYQTYHSFSAWLSHAGTITLVYDPDGAQEYYKQLSVKSMQKGELNQVGWLEVPFSFLHVTPWYLPTPTEFDVSVAADDAIKRYTYCYRPSLRYGLDASGSLSATIQGAGDDPGAVLVRYTGEATNPRIKLVGNISGKTYGNCAAIVTLTAFDTLEYNSSPRHSHLYKIAADGTVTDLLPKIRDLSRCWFMVPIDEPCTMIIESDVALLGTASVTVYYYFWSV